MKARHPRLRHRTTRGARMTLDRPAERCRFSPQLETLELRLLLTTPQILSHDLPAMTEFPISGMSLSLSEPVQGPDARRSDTYDLLALGPDHAPGGGDDWSGEVLPAYVDGSQQIDLQFLGHWPALLEEWKPLSHMDGQAGTWTLDPGLRDVTYVASAEGAPAYMIQRE